MKVRLENNYKNLYTVADLECAKKVIEYEKKEDEMPVMDYAEIALNAIQADHDSIIGVLKVIAHTAKNCRVWNVYGDTQHMDVWLEMTAETWNGFVKAGCYLSDVWMVGTPDFDIRKHAYIKRYKEA